jgi:GNAT superfamily N-acetyltransferase
MHYRQLESNEIPVVLDLWAEEIDVPRERIEAQFNTDPQRLAHTHIAVTEDGEIVSAVHYFVRWIRDAEGMAQPVGALAGVATRADQRGRGIASYLLQQSLAAMEAEGCRWSLLFTEVNGFYEKLGWRTFATGYRQGMLQQERARVPSGVSVRPFALAQEVDGWARLAQIHALYNERRPLTTVRDLDYWRSYASLRLIDPNVTIFVAVKIEHPQDLLGYVIARIHTETIGIIEVGVRPELPDGIDLLLGAVRREAQDRGIGLSRVFLPREAVTDAAVEGYFQGVHHGTYEMLMGRPLTGYSMAEIEATFGAEGAIPWPADDF